MEQNEKLRAESLKEKVRVTKSYKLACIAIQEV